MPLSEFVPADQLEESREYLRAFAERQGVTGMRVTDHVPNTRRALAVAELARDHDRLLAFKEAAMLGYWREGLNLEAEADLGRIAETAGLDPAAAVRASDDPAFLDRVDRLRAEARGRGVSAIPTLFFGDDPFPVVGCQTWERLAAAADRAGAPRR